MAQCHYPSSAVDAAWQDAIRALETLIPYDPPPTDPVQLEAYFAARFAAEEKVDAFLNTLPRLPEGDDLNLIVTCEIRITEMLAAGYTGKLADHVGLLLPLAEGLKSRCDFHLLHHDGPQDAWGAQSRLYAGIIEELRRRAAG